MRSVLKMPNLQLCEYCYIFQARYEVVIRSGDEMFEWTRLLCLSCIELLQDDSEQDDLYVVQVDELV